MTEQTIRVNAAELEERIFRYLSQAGAGLAGLVTILSAALSGAMLDADMIPMTDTTDHETLHCLIRNMSSCQLPEPRALSGRAGMADP